MFNRYIDKITARKKDFAFDHLLPDVCKFKYTNASTINEYGIVTQTFGYRLYNGSENIPCRFDTTRSVRYVHAPFTPVVATEHIINLPLDFNFEITDIIEVGDQLMKIVKKHDLNVWDVVIILNITEFGNENAL